MNNEIKEDGPPALVDALRQLTDEGRQRFIREAVCLNAATLGVTAADALATLWPEGIPAGLQCFL